MPPPPFRPSHAHIHTHTHDSDDSDEGEGGASQLRAACSIRLLPKTLKHTMKAFKTAIQVCVFWSPPAPTHAPACSPARCPRRDPRHRMRPPPEGHSAPACIHMHRRGTRQRMNFSSAPIHSTLKADCVDEEPHLHAYRQWRRWACSAGGTCVGADERTSLSSSSSSSTSSSSSSSSSS